MSADPGTAARLCLHEATPAELDDWDAHTVDVPGGHVFQSRTWGQYRARHGWRSRYLVFDDGFRLLSAERRWPLVGGGSAYLPRGPVSAGEPVELTADRLRIAADWLAARGVDVVSSDPEIPASTGYGALVGARGFAAIEEVQASRHRVALPLAPGVDEATVFAGFTSSLRRNVRLVANRGVRIVRYDHRPWTATNGDAMVRGAEDCANPDALGPVFTRMHGLLMALAERRHFALVPVDAFVDSSSHAVAAGLAVLLEAYAPDGELLATSLFYRHGRRLSYAFSADVVSRRHDYKGVVQLVLWHAIRIAVAEGCVEFDLAGVDVRGARHRPAEGEEMHGLLEMKERFGGQWLDLAGNHEWVARPWRYALGRASARAARVVRRGG